MAACFACLCCFSAGEAVRHQFGAAETKALLAMVGDPTGLEAAASPARRDYFALPVIDSVSDVERAAACRLQRGRCVDGGSSRLPLPSNAGFR